MSDIRDEELNIGADDSGSIRATDSIVAEPVRGVSALKGLYAKSNRKRLYVYIGVFSFLFLVLIYTFFGAENPALKGGASDVQSGKLSSRRVEQGTLIDQEEAERYNNEQLAREQAENPYAHPLVTTNSQDLEEDYSPFAEESNLKVPTRLSESGSTESRESQQGRSNAYAESEEYYDENAMRSADNLARILIDSESVVPTLDKVSWAYARPARNKNDAVASVSGEVDGVDGNDTKSCSVVAARAGSIAMATVDLALNSDVGGPASLTIRNGKLRNYRLIGAFERKEEWLRLELNKLVAPDQTIGVSAIALDVDTTLNAVSGNVNRHTMYRYGWWGFGTVLSAVGKASAANANNDVYISDGVVAQSSKKDTAREIKMAVGSLGEDIGEIMRDRINRPITVTLKSGDEVGVFFLDDVCLESTNN